jgi:hypothetical protein
MYKNGRKMRAIIGKICYNKGARLRENGKTKPPTKEIYYDWLF